MRALASMLLGLLPAVAHAATDHTPPDPAEAAHDSQAPERPAHAHDHPPSGDHASRAAHGLHLPEPLRDDLVLGVEPTQGQIAAKVLAIVPVSAEREVIWATSLEAAVLDGLSVKLEVPLRDNRVHAVQGGMQVSLPRNRSVAAGHAVQWLVEGLLDEDVFAHALSWVMEARIAPQWSVLARLGGRLHAAYGTVEGHGSEHDRVAGDLLADVDLFWSPHHLVDLGLEGGITHRIGGWTGGFVLPQLHLHVIPHLDLQVGAGPGWEQGVLVPEVATRLIVAY